MEPQDDRRNDDATRRAATGAEDPEFTSQLMAAMEARKARYDDAFLHIRARLERAGEHLDELREKLRGFYGSDSHSFRGEFRFDDDVRLIDTGHVEQTPSRMATILGEIIYNHRSALDHLAWQMVLANGGEPEEGPRGTRFPIRRTPPPSNARGSRIIAGGVSDAAAQFVDEVQPYQSGDVFFEHPLWLLDEMSNMDKHRHVVLSGTFVSYTIASDVPTDRPSVAWTGHIATSDEYGAEIVIVPDAQANVRSTARLAVVLHEIGQPAQRELWSTIDELTWYTRQVIERAAQLPEFGGP